MSDDQLLPRPFRVVVAAAPDMEQVSSDEDVTSLPEETDDAWSLDDIEAAYQQALESLDSLEATVAEAVGEPEQTVDVESIGLDPLPTGIPIKVSEAEPTNSFFPSSPPVTQALDVTSRQVLEALLFVGGMTLSSRKLADVLSGSTSPEDVLRWIDELNAIYDAECRPYRIELHEGGYRMQLRSEFEKVRHRVYGFGPREVKLSQEVLEILAFIAYSQPVSEDELEGLGRAGTSGVVRQLLRRELIQLKRGDDTEVRYETAPRFLEVFGLRSMHDLPLPGDFAFK